jgi:hypothetical protein
MKLGIAMTETPFDQFLSTLDFGNITGPTAAEEAHDALERRDLSQRIAVLLASGGLAKLDGSTAGERGAWRDGADFAIETLPEPGESGDGGGAGHVYELTRIQLYAVFIRGICAAYRRVDAAIADATAEAVLALYGREVDTEHAAGWQSNTRSVPITQHKVIRLVLQAGYIYSDLHPSAALQYDE